MSDHKPVKEATPPKAHGWMAEFDDEQKLLEAARKVRDSGYTRTDAFTPFPVHGIDDALGIKPTVLPWFTLIAGATGTTIALTMQIWMNAIDYPYIISGKPYVSLPAFIPVAFELTVLFAAFTTVFAMLGLNGLPKFSNPVFTSPKFDRSTNDRFFLWVDASDKYFNSDKVKGLLEETSPLAVEEVREDASSTEIPKAIIATIFCFILITLIPGAIVLNMRAAKSGSPRLHVFFDMDFQPKHKALDTTTIFADGRVQRPPVPGTVARGDVDGTDAYYLGYESETTAMRTPSSTSELLFVGFQEEAAEQSSGDVPTTDANAAASALAESSSSEQPVAEKPAENASSPETASAEQASSGPIPNDIPIIPEAASPVAPTTTMTAEQQKNWVKEFPLPIDEALYEMGRKKYEQNCSVCHGYAGYGDGLVSQRALALAQGYWLQPTSLHATAVEEQPVGQIFYTISNGKGKMGGYAASLTTKERWAVVLYVRALQRSQNAKESDVPADVSLPEVTAAN